MPAHNRFTVLTDVSTGAPILNRTNAGGFTATFTVGGTQRQAGVLVRGLAGAETAAVEMLATNARDETDALAGDWMAVQVDGVAVAAADVMALAFERGRACLPGRGLQGRSPRLHQTP